MPSSAERDRKLHSLYLLPAFLSSVDMLQRGCALVRGCPLEIAYKRRHTVASCDDPDTSVFPSRLYSKTLTATGRSLEGSSRPARSRARSYLRVSWRRWRSGSRDCVPGQTGHWYAWSMRSSTTGCWHCWPELRASSSPGL